MTRLDNAFQLLLAIGFSIACLRLLWTARQAGRKTIRIFRVVGAIVTASWATFYFHAVFGTAQLQQLADTARLLQYMNLVMFLTWAFVYTEDRWMREARERLKELEASDG